MHIKTFLALSEKFTDGAHKDVRKSQLCRTKPQLPDVVTRLPGKFSCWELETSRSSCCSHLCASRQTPLCFSALLFYSCCFLWIVPCLFWPGQLLLTLEASTQLLSLMGNVLWPHPPQDWTLLRNHPCWYVSLSWHLHSMAVKFYPHVHHTHCEAGRSYFALFSDISTMNEATTLVSPLLSVPLWRPLIKTFAKKRRRRINVFSRVSLILEFSSNCNHQAKGLSSRKRRNFPFNNMPPFGTVVPPAQSITKDFPWWLSQRPGWASSFCRNSITSEYGKSSRQQTVLLMWLEEGPSRKVRASFGQQPPQVLGGWLLRSLSPGVLGFLIAVAL